MVAEMKLEGDLFRGCFRQVRKSPFFGFRNVTSPPHHMAPKLVVFLADGRQCEAGAPPDLPPRNPLELVPEPR